MSIKILSAVRRSLTSVSLVTALLTVACCLYLFFAGILAAYPGLQQDEILFAIPLYSVGAAEYDWTIGGQEIPVMLMPYLGALKTWLYAPLLEFAPASALSLRGPAILSGLVLIVVIYRLLAHCLGRRTALIAAFLIATDATFVLTTAMDWGPVALQRLLFTAAAALLVAFSTTKRTPYLAGAGLCCGLALWDKAVFFWLLAGSGLAVSAVYWRRIKPPLEVGRVAIFGGALCLGAAPLLIYNAEYPGVTVTSTAALSLDEIDSNKVSMLRRTLDGSGLFGYLVFDDWKDGEDSRRTFSKRSASPFAGSQARSSTTPSCTFSSSLSRLV